VTLMGHLKIYTIPTSDEAWLFHLERLLNWFQRSPMRKRPLASSDKPPQI
jgi:hypothetical protein